MPAALDLRQQIAAALGAFGTQPLFDASLGLFDALGYRSERRLRLRSATAEGFLGTFDRATTLNPERALVADWQTVEFLFQLTDAEVRSAALATDELPFDSKGQWDGAIIESYLFLAIELRNPTAREDARRGQAYTRTELAAAIRALNRLFDMPVMLLFRHGDTLSLAVINRRLSKRDTTRDVLEKVTLIKDIAFADPHRAHVEILADLSFHELRQRHTVANFVQLHAAWRETLDIQELNKRFYQQLQHWYFWALGHARFPAGAPKDAEGRDALSLIRLLTRLIFVWFLKEKGLVPDNLFDPRVLITLLRGFAPEGGTGIPACAPKTSQTKMSAPHSVYYRAILQNLFFATLNQEPGQRDWRRKEQNFMAHSLYRHRDDFADPATALDLFRNIPFLNGGLFECLDKVEGSPEKPRYVRIDGFSDRPDSQPVVPDFLFFGPERDADLSEFYEEKKSGKKARPARVRGLMAIFQDFKFTIEENTPLEEDVALDPELLGRVFENLLAAYNPETQVTARKQTGSFYTPREIVDYMTGQALFYALREKVTQTFLSGSQSGTGIPASDASATGIPACAAASATGENDHLENTPPTGMPVCPPPAGMPVSPVTITRRNLPHWRADGAIYWITFRLADALPQEKLRSWKEERDLWLSQHPEPWSDREWKQYDERFGERLEAWLDAGLGSRALARPAVREVVRACLMRFDGDRLRVHAAVIMPTHVHALLEPIQGGAGIPACDSPNTLSQILKGIKGASAREANKLLGTAGTFWLDESYDHIVRSEAQYRHFQRYIADNPAKAGLHPDEYWLYLPQGATDIPVCAQGDTSIPACDPKPTNPTGKNACVTLEEKLHSLLAHDDAPNPFDPAETARLIAAIDDLKVLDPACGSGAFPMGVLHRLVSMLQKLDPGNVRWKQRQLDKAAELTDADVRELVTRDIEDAFASNELGYGRKLYLIENCLYGVDIQPIAAQIAKLRFFISLVVDQRVNDRAPNRGIRPLPNLETKIVAANTLIGIERKQQQADFLTEDTAAHIELHRLRHELTKVRDEHFRARTPKKKARCREDDRRIRAAMSGLLEKAGMSAALSKQLSGWDPYDQNASAPFFDNEWMFGLVEGFDVVIANPPYVRQEAIKDAKLLLKAQNYECFEGAADLFVYFYEKAVELLRAGGALVFISSNKYYRAGYGGKLRTFLARELTLHQLIDFGDAPVFEAIAYASVLTATLQSPTHDTKTHGYTWEKEIPFDRIGQIVPERGQHFLQTELSPAGWQFSTPGLHDLRRKFESAGIPLGKFVGELVFNGIKSGHKDAFTLSNEQRLRFAKTEPESAALVKPLLKGRDIKRWQVEPTSRWVLYIPWHFPFEPDSAIDSASTVAESAFRKRFPKVFAHLSAFRDELEKRDQSEIGIRYEWFCLSRPRPESAAYFLSPKIVFPDIAPEPSFAWDDGGHTVENTAYFIPAQKWLLGVLNSKAVFWFFRQISNAIRGGFVRFIRQYVEQIPIPSVSLDEQRILEGLVDQILAAKRADPEADTRALEGEIDRQVYALYGLTPAEIQLVESASAK